MECQLTLIQEKIMATLDEVLAQVASNSNRLDSVIAFTDGLEDQLADALANANLSPENQAKVDDIFSKVRDNAAKIDTALNEGTPPAE